MKVGDKHSSMNASAQVSGGPVFSAARMEDLPEVAAFVEDACRRAGANSDDAFAIRLAVEEAFTNVLQHGYGDQPGPVRFGLQLDPAQIAITLVDEAPPFDPADAPAPDLDAALEERDGGGLGWHLICRMMDEVKHERGREHGNVVTLVKRLT